MTEASGVRLSIPELPEDCDLLRAALEYAKSGWYVGPLKRKTKSPGSILGDKWHHQTSRDTDQIVEWFAGTDAGGLFLHVGRSGGVLFDVDYPDLVPEVLAKYLWAVDPLGDREAAVPYQRTRPAVAWRGHYLFLQPLGRLLGNSRGDLGKDWGEVRGYNGIIVVFPTEHEEETGEYAWERTGAVSPLPQELDARLPDMGSIEDAASDESVEAFLAANSMATNANLMKAPLEDFTQRVKDGESRHETCVSVATWMMRDAAQGWYPARLALKELWPLFRDAMAGTPRRWPRSEFKSIVAWAVGQALGADAEKRREEVRQRLADNDEKRRQADPPPIDAVDVKVDPDKYFLDKTIGCDVALIADDVLKLGPLANGRDGAYWVYESGVWRRNPKVVQRRVVHLLGPRYRAAHTTNAEHVVSARLPTISCDPVSHWWNVQNGMLNWRTGELVDHDPDHHSTVQFPFEWDETATCPKFDNFLDSVLSPSYVKLAWQMIGYLLYSGNPFQVAFLLHGSGSNGKGTLLRVIAAMIGKENFSSASLTDLNSNRFSAVSLFGMIANLAGDIDSTFQQETARFKALVGEDTIFGEHKYGNAFPFVNWAVPVFSANQIPGSGDTGYSYLRRWQVLRFGREIGKDQIIPGYSNMLIAEIPGIAVKARVALAELMESGWFVLDEEIEAGQDEFAKAIDQVRQWVDEACIVTAENMENRTDLYKSYRAWADANGVGRLKATEFYSRLEKAGFPAYKSNGIRYHKGLRVIAWRMHGDPSSGGSAPTEPTNTWDDESPLT